MPELPASLPHSPSGGTSLHTLANGGCSAGPRREGQCIALQSTPATSGPRSSVAYRPPTPPTRRGPTRPRRLQPRTPAPTPELNATQKWWAAFMGDRAFARARAAGKNETEAGHARAKAEADIALSLPADTGTRKMTRERNISYTQPSWQQNAGGVTHAQTPTPPAACDRNALSAL